MQINSHDIPDSAIDLANYVDRFFIDIHPRLYTIDIMFENKKPWIIELNDNPGMPDTSVQPFTDNYLPTLLSFLSNTRSRTK